MRAAVCAGVWTMQKPGEELLVAYLDGELDEAQRSEVEAWLGQDSAAREQLARLSETASLLRAAFDEVLREEVPNGSSPPRAAKAPATARAPPKSCPSARPAGSPALPVDAIGGSPSRSPPRSSA
jgi:anti-sigma factor RsiW